MGNNASIPVNPPVLQNPESYDIESRIRKFLFQCINPTSQSIQQITQSSHNSEESFQQDFCYQIDKRKEVPDNRVHPYNGVGRVIYSLLTSSNEIISGKATGFLITKKHVLTCAHIFRSKGERKYLKHSRLQFFPEPLSKDECYENGIKAEILHIDHRYFQSNNLEGRFFDCAVLQLAEDSKISQQMVLKCNFEYFHNKKQVNKDLINIPTYPSDFTLRVLSQIPDFSITKALFFDQSQAIGQEPAGILTYEHSTTWGVAGAPLLLKKVDNSYEVVGIHIEKHRELNCGLLFRQCSLKQPIMSLVKEQASHSPSSLVFQQLLSEYSKNQLLINYITDLKLKTLAENGDKFNRLQIIHIYNNKITDAGLKALAKKGDNFESLKIIDLSYNQITNLGLKALAENGDKFKSLQSINFWGNQITDEGLKALAANGDKFQNLQSINFSHNKIANEGMNALAGNGDKFKSLQGIYLSWNKIADGGLEMLAHNGDKFKSLQIIDLSNNQITDAGLKALAENGDKFESLKKMYLGANIITDAGLRSLFRSGKNFKSMQKISLQNNQITEAGRQQLAFLKNKFAFKINA